MSVSMLVSGFSGSWRRKLSLWLGCAVFASMAGGLGCEGCEDAAGPGPAGSTSAASATPPSAGAPKKALRTTGAAIAMAPDGSRLYVADEDHQQLRVVPLPLAEASELEAMPEPSPSPSQSASSAPPGPPSAMALPTPPASPPPEDDATKRPPPALASSHTHALPGRPANVLALDGRVLVTIRDPGLLLILEDGPSPSSPLSEVARVALPADAWGLAVTPDERWAVVTSAWTHQVTGIDTGAAPQDDANKKGRIAWTVSVDREPRGVVVGPDGKSVYISHLTSSRTLTKIEGITSDAPKVRTIEFPAAPSRTPLGHPLPASLGYALALDPNGHRLLAARHALGALADFSWYGVATVDVLATQTDEPLLAPRKPDHRIGVTPAFSESREFFLKQTEPWQDWYKKQFTGPDLKLTNAVQPRDMIVAASTKSVWIASEGNDLVAEYPLYAAAPTERVLRMVRVGRYYDDAQIIGSGYSDSDGIASVCAAPTGLALSPDESHLFVYCRATSDIAAIRILDPEMPELRPTAVAIRRLVDEPLDNAMSRGQRLFYGARDGYSSGGLGCAGCHPEGRDDGHVWHEILEEESQAKLAVFFASHMLAEKTKAGRLGYPRQTPMLAGRVDATGPYGWQAQNKNIRERLAEGFQLHRWSAEEIPPEHWMVGTRYVALTEYLRKGLVTPPRNDAPLSDQERLGKEIFEGERAQCSTCHLPAEDFTDRFAYPMPSPAPPGFEDEPKQDFRTPSLLFVGGTPPYFHDGRVASLRALIEANRDKMGKTSHLKPEERDALVAYLERL